MAEGADKDNDNNETDVTDCGITQAVKVSDDANGSTSSLLSDPDDLQEGLKMSEDTRTSGCFTSKTLDKSADSMTVSYRASFDNTHENQVVQLTLNKTDDTVATDAGDGSKRHLKSSSLPHGAKLCSEENSSERKDTCQNEACGTSDEEKEINGTSLEEELRKAQTELKAKDAEMEMLKGIREQVEGELTDLTAALFEEAHKMVTAAKMKEVASEKNLKEAKMQLEGLQAEVAALKTLLITSTPSRPNLGGNGISIFKKQHKRCPSHNHLQYGRDDDEVESKSKNGHKSNDVVIDRDKCEIDPVLLTMFAEWRHDPTVSFSSTKSEFLLRVLKEDIDPCLAFANEALRQRLRVAIEENSIWVEPIPEKDKRSVPTECTLLQRPRLCHHRMRFAFDSKEWFDISQICRDRIAAVCEFLSYLRYMKNGLVKASTDDAYWEVIRLRKQMALAKLGIPIS